MKSSTIIATGFVLVTALLLCAFPVSGYSEAATARYMEGQSDIASGNYSEAVAAFDAAIALEPEYYEAWNEKADAYNRNEQFNEALAASDKALAINPDYVNGWINRGYILYNLGRQSDELSAYESALAIDSENADAWFNKAYALAGMKRFDEALQAFDNVAEINPTYPHLAENRKIAENLKNASTPFYIKYAFVLIIIAIVVIGAVAWYLAVRKKY